MSWDYYWSRCFKVFVFLKLNFWIFKKKFFLFSSSDSDSDPEGGELLDIGYRKDRQQASKKKLQKKQSNKTVEERNKKLNRKRQVNIFMTILQ